ncbi:hypothetical protein Tco_0576259 [Tanacetum coccineum]
MDELHVRLNILRLTISPEACSFMLYDLDFEPLSLSLSSMPSCDLESLTNILIQCLILKASNQSLRNAVLFFGNQFTSLSPRILYHSEVLFVYQGIRNDQRLKMLLVQSQKSFGYQIKAFGYQKWDSSIYQDLGDCFKPYKLSSGKGLEKTCVLRLHRIIRTASKGELDLWQAVVLFELAWLDFHKLVLMDDLWSIGNHDFVVEMNDHRMKCAGLYIFSSKVERNSTLVVIESVFSAIGKTFYLGARGQSFHNLTPFILEERGPKRHFQQHLLSLWCNACGYNASAQNDNEVLEAESIVQAASTECGSIFRQRRLCSGVRGVEV